MEMSEIFVSCILTKTEKHLAKHFYFCPPTRKFSQEGLLVPIANLSKCKTMSQMVLMYPTHNVIFCVYCIRENNTLLEVFDTFL